MSFNEPYFALMSNYSNTNKGMSVDAVEAWLDQFPQKRAENKPNGGIIQSLADTRELFLRPMSKADRAAAAVRAQREHRQALKNVAKQEAADAKEIAKKLAEWRKEDRRKDRQPKQVSDGLTRSGREVLKALEDKGYYDVADFKHSYEYFHQILAAIRRMGHKLKSERQGRTIVRYVLDKQ